MKLHLSGIDHIRRIATQSALAAAAVLAAAGTAVSAQQRQTAHVASDIAVAFDSPAGLERAFWVCDYAGTHLGVDPATGAACVAITEALKQSKFNGDFDALLAWWRTHKPAEHRAIAETMSDGTAR
jgi:hypothetical protein